MIRSVLIAPGAVAGVLGARADALVLDLGSAPPQHNEDARRRTAAILCDPSRADWAGRLWVRLHPLSSSETEADLRAVCGSRPDALLLPETERAEDVPHLGAMLAVQEAEAGLDDGSLRVVPIAETSASLFELIAIARSSARLAALGWNGEALAFDLGADEARDPDGRWSDPLQTARTLTLAACADAGLPAIDSVFRTDDLEAFRREAEAARRDGFSGKFALSAEQAAIVDEVFSAPNPPA